MVIQKIAAKEIWDSFIQSVNAFNQLTQSWAWGEFQKNVGWKVERLGVWENDCLVGVMQWYQLPLPFGWSYGYAPRGPIFLEEEKSNEAANLLFAEIKKSLGNKGVFLRCEPMQKIQQLSQHAPEHAVAMQPQYEWLVDLAQDEEMLLAGMHQKTRYNIHLAEKKGVCVQNMHKQDFENAWQVFQQTSERGSYHLHTKSYYGKMLAFDEAKLVGAYDKDILLAVTLLWTFGDMVTYVHGASDYTQRNFMAPYLLHWENLKRAKAIGMKWYSFGGVAPDDDLSHSWRGITRFKKGFGGKMYAYPGTFDLVFDKNKYWLYCVSRKIKNSL
ncbi:MAG: hypothetical protein COT39_02185 [Parcubacteria group bacterium CG08_land_8_20_14_0_20_48_21]|nr:MAG: hypothetical protein AUK21_01610 [Parcubacteria group bacterium CG2_30_48_51]PIS32875.1 MAG: hypothetical protein COT39_02185 [Parcubacteria group bacterium CG08_land_8_20_14_0_20_48_21]PIW78787.1 MAG: hypothetical protein COZ99_04565 [Parcubacteria group bacterium CG_4_8_14_3_um_filter_48_16]PIY78244.1 MAG: hypothetical protein COY83_00825 [Parcubacteria group bacterium CG_4_10_14_0_8_um_filter_48_154]PIZ77595.1 MAG: hypothetical protein COY03_02210 [bacterium CG_4_10_14_0_2_um_filter_